MNFQRKSALMMFLLGSALLFSMSVVYYSTSRNSVIKQARSSSVRMAEDVAHSMDLFLMEKGRVAKTMASTPLLTHTLIQSNSDYSGLSDTKRQEHIDNLNGRWRATQSIDDPVVQGVLSNPAAHYFRTQQTIFPGEYGEIFLTNRYGALVASTGKLTTFAHAHKYWWKASYHGGKGKTFFDDRGYDTSVEGYVLGVVVPIKQDDEIIGILKINLNVTDALTNVIESLGHHGDTKEVLRLVRTGGLIVLEEGQEPLSTRVPDILVNAIKRWLSGSLISHGDGDAELLAYAPVRLTHKSDDYAFGGSSQKSIDHSGGNDGEGWHIVSVQPLRVLLRATGRTTLTIVVAGIAFGLILAYGAWLLSKTLTQPIMMLIEHSQKIGRGDFDVETDVASKDELGILARSFNTMTRDLRQTMISRDLLIEEAEQRKQAEEELQETLAEIERFNKLMIGREGRVIEIKKEINALLAELGREPQYKSGLEDEDNEIISTGNSL